MSVNGPAESAGQPPHSAADGPSPFAPKWVRDPGDESKVVPLHLPAAPQLVPGAAPSDEPGPPPARGPRPSGPDLLAEDAVLKRLLQRHAPDPHPLDLKPVADPVGLALGMVARLVVAGCGAAALIMLLLGIIPSPLRWGPAESEVAPAGPVAATSDALVPRQVADASNGGVLPAAVDGAVAANNGSAPADVAAAPPVPAPAVAPRAVPAGGGDATAFEPGEVERLVKRGEAYLAQGDIAAARLVLGRAAEARDARATFSLGASYDPAVLKKLHVVGFRPDLAQARAWYEKAASYGSADASQRLAALPGAAQ